MATCKECIHQKSCFNMAFRCGYKAEALDGAEECEDFKNKADFMEVKHGEWIEKDCITESNRGRTIHYVTNKCSVCGKWNGRHKSDYCPRCGAKMDGERKENND